MDHVTLRAVGDDDWSAILDLAQRSLTELPAAPSQAEWIQNRRSFSTSDGIQQHFVATSDERIVGYACVERRNTAAHGWYRLFVVVEPAARATLGTTLFANLRERLISLGARHARMVEYDADTGFISYLKDLGFHPRKSSSLNDGSTAIELIIDAPFQSLER
jgi:hypothetical protein